MTTTRLIEAIRKEQLFLMKLRIDSYDQAMKKRDPLWGMSTRVCLKEQSDSLSRILKDLDSGED